ncbi:RHS repeat-associated core domain-containing protein [Escherichia coli]|nr:PAAR/RHS domain-containing protein [Escherichia coli]EKK5465633.1 PAAR/RHS domain-containing protein [Escherichia coli]MEC9657377.1 RHS repeat-associated core domain-containing protein [Escherichia coli]MEC9890266.1 RHS repeat-associated core domain-containing protein [Escherichia coli]MED9368961.1 RHS repeat-associated core domain-containing protein [Escherichia coli]
MYEAARVDDPIYHTSALAGFLIGAIIGIAIIAVASFAFFTCGFLAGLILSFLADQIASGVLQLGEAIGRSIHSTVGKILTGSDNVSTNSRPAARAVLSTVICEDHSPEIRIAQGSGNIYINSQPAARKDDHTECDAVIEDGSPNVFLGGGTQTVLEISPEIPDWLRQVVDVLYVVAGMFGGLAGAARQAAKLGTKFGTKCAAKFIGGQLVGMGVSDAVMGLFSNPVDVTTGQKILLPETDFTLPGRLPVTCSRFYASHLETEGLLGRGWRLNWEINLREDETYITFIGVQGRELSYPKAMLTPGHQIFDPEEQFYLSRLHDGRYVLHYTDRSYYVFDEFDDHGVAPLLFLETPYRQRIAFGRENGRLVRVASSSGHHLLLHRTMTPAGERLSHIELVKGGRPGNLVEYRYDDNGQLTGVVNRAGMTVRQFAWENGLMTEHRNATGFTCTYRWQEIDGFPRVVEHTTSDGEHYRFHYDFVGGHTVVTGRPGQRWQWWFDEETYVTAHRTPGGGMYRFTYNENHFPVAVELPGERRVMLEYDTLSRVVKETDPAGRVTQTQWNGSFAEITRRALDDDHVWKADYNEHGQVIQETDPEGRVTRYGYDEQGLAVSRTDARGGGVALVHDARGQLTRYTDCSGRTTDYDYDEDGNLTTVTDAEGKAVRIRYNRLGLPETVNHPGKQQDRYTWNALGLLSSHRRITGSVQSWRYTPRGLPAVHTDEEKRETRWQYTAEGMVASLSNGNGAQYQFSHDADGRLTGEKHPDGLIRMFALNAGGFPVIIQTQGTEGGMRNERQERDALGRLLRSDTQHSTRTFSYNRLDQITEVTLTPTEEGERLHHMQADRVHFAYDSSGWLTAEHSVHGSIKYRRDALGNPTDITLPDGQHLSHLYYGSGHLLQTALDGITVSEYERDSLHRQVMRTQGKLTTFSGYNADNRLSWQRSLPGGSQNPQQTATHPSHGDSVTARDYIWNADGEVGGINDKLRGCLVFSYDRSGWLTSRTGQMYDHDHYYYDKAGNLLTDEYQSAVLDNRLPGYGRDRYRYNEWGELTERRDQQLEWNAQGQLTRVISSNSETRYQYDALGRRISKATSNLHTDRGERSRTTFVWEGFRLLQDTTWQGKRTYLYDAEQPYTPVAVITGRGESRKIWYYHTDLTGTVQEVTAADGTLVWAGYQAGFGENRGDISNSGAYFEQPLRLPGQYFDEETGLYYNLFRYYAPECGRFISQDPIGLRGGLNLYAYAPNPLKYIDPLGLCKTDVENKNPYGTYRPARQLHRDKNGNPIPDVNAPHTQLGTKSGRKGDYTQAREWGYDENGNLVPKRDIDFTDHGRPKEHPNPHQHDYIPNPTGGTLQHGPAKDLEIP